MPVNKPLKEPHFCPYCDEEIAEAAFPYCEACGVNTLSCPECGKVVPRGEKVCPNCGADVSKAAGGC
jgi:RNA polymerase subunit RPABC4/transcription elongation factor Spt4